MMFNPASSCCGGSRVSQGSTLKSRRLRVVLDIDETLIHAEVGREMGRNGMAGQSKDKVNGVEVSIKTNDGVVHQVVVRKRPGVDGFLRKLAKRNMACFHRFGGVLRTTNFEDARPGKQHFQGVL